MRTVEDSAFTQRFDAALAQMGRRHRRLLAIDSSDRDSEDLAREIADELLGEVPHPRGAGRDLPHRLGTPGRPEFPRGDHAVSTALPSRAPVGLTTLETRQAAAHHLWHPWSPIAVDPEQRLVIESGEDCHVVDDRGRRFLDLRAGTLNAVVGYGQQHVVDAVARQAAQLMTWDLAEVVTPPAAQLAARIASLTPAGLSRTLFCNSGSEGIEAAIKIARMSQRLAGHEQRTVVLSISDGYHGATTAGIAATGSPFRREGAGPFPDGYVHLATPRCRDCTAGAGTHTCQVPGIAEWEQQILEVGPETVAAVLVEPVLSVGGVIVPPAGSLRALAELCTRHGILVIADEVATGFGRTGQWFGFQHDLAPDVGPDILVTSKGLAGGYAPLSAVTVREELYQRFGQDAAGTPSPTDGRRSPAGRGLADDSRVAQVPVPVPGSGTQG